MTLSSPGKTTATTSPTGNSALGFIRRNITTNSTEIKYTAHKQIVQPVLGHASRSWHSLTKTQKEELEVVQRRAARLIYNIKRTDYKTSTTNLLAELQLDKLSDRRSHSRLKLFGQYHFNEKDTIRDYLQRTCLASR